MTHKISFHFAAGAALLLLAPLTTSHAQYARGGSRLGAFSGGGAGRAGAINSAPGARGYTGASFRNNRGGYYGGRGGYYGGRGGYYGGRNGYYGGRSRYFHRGSYYYYDPFFFGGFGYPSYYYGGFGPGFGVGYYGAPGYYGGGYGDGDYYGGGDRVYSGRIASEVNGNRRRGGDDDREGSYSPNSMARAVQSELKERGYYRGAVDGQFGAGTASALRAFQRDKGLKVTGRLDERTLKALNFDER